MNLSNANPIQFWLNDQETFNEKVVPGVQSLPYSQKFQLSDEIKIQVGGTEGEPTLILYVYDCNDAIVAQQEFVDHDTYQDVTFTFSLLGLSDGYYRLQIESPLSLEAGTGVINIFGQDAATGGNFSITPLVGSLTITGQDVELELLAGSITLQATLSLEAFGAQTFGVDFDGTTLHVTGNGGSDAGEREYEASVPMIVGKDTNGGVAQSAVVISFFKNGSLVHSVGFSDGQTVYVEYTYTSVNNHDTLLVDISEG